MAFFDGMDRKLSQFGQSVSNKSREVSEGMRLSSAIKAEEEKQNNLYREVGKYYFENCAANAEGQLKVLCDQIVASMELTSQYKQQQNVLKRMISCPNCGAQIPANSGFCNVCGSKIEKQIPPAPQPGAGKICPKCQKTVEADAVFCTFCGNKFEAQSAAPAYEEPAAPAYEEPTAPAYEEPAAPANEEPAAPAYEEPAAPANEEPAAPVYEEPAAPAYEEVHIPEVTVPTCLKCGAVLEEGQKFCTVCGTKVGEEPAAPVQHMQSLTCRSCGAALKEGQKFCTKCGTPVA